MAQGDTEQALIQPRLPRGHGQPLTHSPPGAEQDAAAEEGVTTAWLGGTHPSTWTRTSRLWAGTALCTACLPLPGKFSQQNQAPLLSFRHSCRDPGAGVSRRGERGKERAPASAGTKAPLTHSKPSSSGMHSPQQARLLCAVQASLQRNSPEMPLR